MRILQAARGRGLLALLGVLSTLAFSQAVNHTGVNGQLIPITSGVVRETHPGYTKVFNPEFHAFNDRLSDIDADQNLTRNTAFAYSLSNRVFIPEGAPEGSLGIAVQSGSLPTGVTLQTTTACETAALVGYCLKGSPTTATTYNFTLRATFTPDTGLGSPTTSDQLFHWVVQPDPDVTAPPAPGNVSATALSSTSARFTIVTPVVDASGINHYDVTSSTSAANCALHTQNLQTITPPATFVDRTALTLGGTYWYAARAQDNALNNGPWSPCTSVVLPGGGPATPNWVNNIQMEDVPDTLIPATNAITNNVIWRRASQGVCDLSVSPTAFAGSGSLFARHTKTNQTNTHCEMQVKDSLRGTTALNIGPYRFGLAVRIPGTTTTTSNNVVFQWHESGTNTACNNEPLIGIRLINSNWVITRFGTGAELTTTTVPVTRNVWHTFYGSILWRPNNTGNILIRMDGVTIFQSTAERTLCDAANLVPYLRIGPSAEDSWALPSNGDSNGAEHASYYDNIKSCIFDAALNPNCFETRVTPQSAPGDETGPTNTVAPSGGAVTTTQITWNIGTWTDASGILNYTPQTATNVAGPWTSRPVQTTLTYVQTGLTANTQYFFRVIAADTLGNQTTSVAVNRTTATGGAVLQRYDPFDTPATYTGNTNPLWNTVTDVPASPCVISVSTTHPRAGASSLRFLQNPINNTGQAHCMIVGKTGNDTTSIVGHRYFVGFSIYHAAPMIDQGNNTGYDIIFQQHGHNQIGACPPTCPAYTGSFNPMFTIDAELGRNLPYQIQIQGSSGISNTQPVPKRAFEAAKTTCGNVLENTWTDWVIEYLHGGGVANDGNHYGAMPDGLIRIYRGNPLPLTAGAPCATYTGLNYYVGDTIGGPYHSVPMYHGQGAAGTLPVIRDTYFDEYRRCDATASGCTYADVVPR